VILDRFLGRPSTTTRGHPQLIATAIDLVETVGQCAS
jgi:hypothetical protein